MIKVEILDDDLQELIKYGVNAENIRKLLETRSF